MAEWEWKAHEFRRGEFKIRLVSSDLPDLQKKRRFSTFCRSTISASCLIKQRKL